MDLRHTHYFLAALMFVASSCGSSREAIGSDGIIVTAADNPWTVVAVAPDGSWGVGTKPYIYLAITEAVSNCKKMFKKNIGCGAQLQAIQAGWVILNRCNQTNILAPGRTLADAIEVASQREVSLRSKTLQTIAQCAHILTVDPDGAAHEAVSELPWNGSLIPQTISTSRPGMRSTSKD